MAKRVQWVDIAKGISIALVIIGHTLLNDDILRKLIFSFHMPVFFILAGYTFRVKPNKEVLASSAKRLLVPYCLIFIARTTIRMLKSETIGANQLLSSGLSMLFASGVEIAPLNAPAAGMIWFLVSLFCARVTLNALTSMFDRRGVSLQWQFLFWLAFAFVGIVLGDPFGTIPALASVGVPNHVFLPLNYDVTMVACLLMFIGYVWRSHGLDELLAKWWTLPIAIALWLIALQFSYLEFAARRYYMWPFALLGAVSGSYIVFWISRFTEGYLKFLAKPLVWMGVNSMLLFCIHAFDMYFAPWQSLPLLTGVSHALLIAGFIRLAIDLIVANVVKRM